ncbi:MAG TPA: hypothetical protein VFI40_04910 [Nocardioides sp.]|nr:hypothetical protein [Nocardioides sp.]
MSHETALTLALLAALALLAFLGWWANQCRCDACAYHKHERLVAAEKARVEREQIARKAADLRHEQQHKGSMALSSDPDRFDCPDGDCRRNRRQEGSPE